MNKIVLIIKREYLSRVKKKSFLLVTFLVPLFLIGIYAVTIMLTMKSFENNRATIHVIDQSGLFSGQLIDSKNIAFIDAGNDVVQEKEKIGRGDQEKTHLLIIPADIENTSSVELFSSETASFGVKDEIEGQLEAILRDRAFEAAGIDKDMVSGIKPNVSIQAKEITGGSERDSSTGAAMGVAMSLSILIYICLLLYGTQVMRGIIEEKNNRIVEIIISSVKPFQLMMGKIIGIGLVGLTQFLLWIVLSTGLMSVATTGFMSSDDVENVLKSDRPLSAAGEGQAASYDAGAFGNFMQAMDTLDFQTLIVSFVLYFLGGYLLYSALFAAIGSAVDSETETQQMQFPITMPLLFTYILSFGVLINDPNGPLAFWLSMIPLTSPIAMLVRIPFGVPEWQIALSLLLLVLGFILTTWIAARIYRVGILMYGKKASYKELVKWFRYRN